MCVCLQIEIWLLTANVKDLHTSVDYNWWLFCFPAQDETNHFFPDCNVICSSASKGGSNEVIIASRASQASEVTSITLTNLYHTHKQIFKSEADCFIDCIRLGCYVEQQGPKDVHVTPETCEYVALHNKRDFAVIMLRILRWGDHLGWSLDGPNVITRVFIRGRQESQRHRRCDNRSRGWCHMRKGPKAKESRHPPKTGNSRKYILH